MVSGRRTPPKRAKVIGFSRDYRRVRRFDMGLPPRRPRRRRRPAVWVALLIAALFILPDITVAALQFARSGDPCKVVAVTDGDTVRLWCPGQGVMNTRLTGYDTPEVFSPKCLSERISGLVAIWHLRRFLITARETSVTVFGTDRYDRRLAALELDGVLLADRMIQTGHARAYSGGPRRSWCSAENPPHDLFQKARQR